MGAAEKLPQLYNEAETARSLGVSEVTLRRIRGRNEIGYIKIGRKAMYTEHQITKYLESQTCHASASATTGSNNAKDRQSGIGHGGTRQDASSALRLAQETLQKHKSH